MTEGLLGAGRDSVPEPGDIDSWGLVDDVARLAVLLSPAARIEAELLRHVRLQCLPGSDVGIEQDLWFSALVSARSNAGITFADDVTVELRGRLAVLYREDPDVVERAREAMTTTHDGLSPLLSIEEELAWADIVGDEQSEERIAALLVRAVAAGRPDIDHWLARVWHTIPATVQQSPDGWVLGQVAAVRGARFVNGARPSTLGTEQLAALLSSVPDVPLYISGDAVHGYHLGVDAQDAEVSIAVPETVPRLLEVRGGNQPGARRIELTPGSVVEVVAGTEPVEIRTARGAVYVLDGQVGTLLDLVLIDAAGHWCAVPLPDDWVIATTDADPRAFASSLPSTGPLIHLPSLLGDEMAELAERTYLARTVLPGRHAFKLGHVKPGASVQTLAFDAARHPRVHTVRWRSAPFGRPADLETHGRRLLPGAPLVNEDATLAGVAVPGPAESVDSVAIPANMLFDALERLARAPSLGPHVLLVLDDYFAGLPEDVPLPDLVANHLRPEGTLWIASSAAGSSMKLLGVIEHCSPGRRGVRRRQVSIGSEPRLILLLDGDEASDLLSPLLEGDVATTTGGQWVLVPPEAAVAIQGFADRLRHVERSSASSPTPVASGSTGPALRTGDFVVCPLVDGPKPHVGGPITPAAAIPTVLIGGMPAAVANSTPGGIVCVSPAPNGIAMGSMTVLIGGFPAARLGDLSMHGSPIVPGPGCPTVIIG